MNHYGDRVRALMLPGVTPLWKCAHVIGTIVFTLRRSTVITDLIQDSQGKMSTLFSLLNHARVILPAVCFDPVLGHDNRTAV